MKRNILRNYYFVEYSFICDNETYLKGSALLSMFKLEILKIEEIRELICQKSQEKSFENLLINNITKL